mgnify:FL=1|jgi:2,3-bisphosphoglycerate-dependent phosphoglycerate mutase
MKAKEKTLYLIRHAQSHRKSSCHHSEWPLSEKGTEQAAGLAGLLEPLGIQKVVSSPFLRCRQTVEPYLRKSGVEVVFEHDLRERLISRGITDGFFDLWCKSWEDFDFALPGCETSAIAQERFATVMQKIVSENQTNTIAISTHGNVIGLFLNHLDDSLGRDEAEKLMNPDVLKFTVQDGIFLWDRDFDLPGIDEIRTHHMQTPVDD